MADIAERLLNYGDSHLKGCPVVITEAVAEIGRLRKAIEDLEAKADLGAQCMESDERGRNVAAGFKVIADFARKSLDFPSNRANEG